MLRRSNVAVGQAKFRSQIDKHFSSTYVSDVDHKTRKQPGVLSQRRVCAILLLVISLLILAAHTTGWSLLKRPAKQPPLPSSLTHVSEGARIQATATKAARASNLSNDNTVSRVVRQALGKLYDPPTVASNNLTFSGDSRMLCLEAIRRRQSELLLPVMFDAVATTQEILLVDPAYHANVGDNMITLAEQAFVQLGFQTNGVETKLSSPRTSYVYRECSYIQAQSFALPCQELLSQTSSSSSPFGGNGDSRRVALWHGGGNWGDLWPKIHDLRTGSLELLLRNNYTVLGMPQSLYFANPNKEQENAVQLRESVQRGLGALVATTETSARQRLILSWRELHSYEKAQQLYPFATHLLVPDIAFQLGPYQPAVDIADSVPKVDILLFLRSDHESIFQSQRDRHVVSKIISSFMPESTRRPYSFSIVDWSDRFDRFSEEDENMTVDEKSIKKNVLFTETSIRLLKMGKVVVCDRLHATILAYISNLSFVYLDQVSGKISKTMNVALNSDPKVCQHGKWQSGADHGEGPWWRQASNLTRGIGIAIEMLEAMGNGRQSRRRQRKHHH